MNHDTPAIPSFTFAVDDVEPKRALHGSQPAEHCILDQFKHTNVYWRDPVRPGVRQPDKSWDIPQGAWSKHHSRLILGHSPLPELIASTQCHAVLHAVHVAFSNHYPLAFSPDTIWHLVLQGVSRHIANSPEQHRKHFVSFEGKKTLSIYRPDLNLDDLCGIGAELPSIVDRFKVEMAKHVTPAYLKAFEATYSTTTPVDHTVAAITCLEAFSPYFELFMGAACGFPSITVTGSVEDWQKLRAKVVEIESLFNISPETNLTWWTQKLIMVVDQFIAAADGKPEIEWWKRMYKHISTYGSDTFNGWIGWLWPYVDPKPGSLWSRGTTFTTRNPMLEDISSEVTIRRSPHGGTEVKFNEVTGQYDPVPDPGPRTVDMDKGRSISVSMGETFSAKGAFLHTNQFPGGLSQVDLVIGNAPTREASTVALKTTLMGGFVGAFQSSNDYTLTPQVGYALVL